MNSVNRFYITSNKLGAGKTVLAASLLLKLIAKGRKVGYFKPFCSNKSDDGDVAFFRQLDNCFVIDPVALRLDAVVDSSPAVVIEQVKESVDGLDVNYDTLIVEGPSLQLPNGDSLDLSYYLPKALDAGVLVISEYEVDRSLESLAETFKASFEERLLGTIVNLVTGHRIRHVNGLLSKKIREDMKSLGVVPEDRLMLSITLGDLADHLDAKWVAGQEKASELVERFIIGGNIMDSGQTYFGRGSNEAVVVRGDRPDIQLAALTTSINALILTGGHYPVEYVRHEVEREGVSLMVVPHKTNMAMDILSKALTKVTPYHYQKVLRFQELLDLHCDMDPIYSDAT